MATPDGPDLSIVDLVTCLWRRADDELRAKVGPPLDPETDEPQDPRSIILGVDVGRERAVAEGWLYARTSLTPSTLAEYFGPLAYGQVPATDVVERIAPVLANLDTPTNRRSLWGHLEAAAPGLADEMRKAIAGDEALTDGEKKAWRSLEGKQLKSKALADAVGTEESYARRLVGNLRGKGRKVETALGGGYWRPDAPPPE